MSEDEATGGHGIARQYRLRRAPRRAPAIVVHEWTIEVAADGATVLRAGADPLFAAEALAELLAALGIAEGDLVEIAVDSL